MAVKDYNVDPDLNTTIEGINIAEGCPPSGINNAIRQLMADVKVESEAKAEKDAEQDAAIRQAQSSAEEAKTTADNALPKSGGTMTGDILVGNSGKISIDESAGYVVLASYTDGKTGAKVLCRGLNAPTRPGSVLLIGRTSDGLEGTPVWVMPDGNIEVNGKNLVRLVNGVAADASGNVKWVVSSNLKHNGYVQYANGLVFIWGEMDMKTSKTTITKPIACTTRIALVCDMTYSAGVAQHFFVWRADLSTSTTDTFEGSNTVTAGGVGYFIIGSV